MDPEKQAAIRQIPKDELLYLTYEKIYDTHEDVQKLGTRVKRLEDFKTKIIGGFTVISALVSLGWLKAKAGK